MPKSNWRAAGGAIGPVLRRAQEVPCSRSGGQLAVYRQEVRPFTDKQVALLKNFAAQAIITRNGISGFGSVNDPVFPRPTGHHNYSFSE